MHPFILLFLLLAKTCLAGENPSPQPDTPDSTTIVIREHHLAVENRLDRTIYQLTDNVQATQGNLAEVLGNIPSIDVDPDGAVSLRGDTNVLILIDGHPAAALQGSAAAENLQSMAAADVERIEVLTTPPPEFRADGAAGVINIVTRKQGATRQSPRHNAQVSVGAAGRSQLIVGTGLAWDAWTATLKAGYRHDYRIRHIQSDIVATDPVSGVTQQGHSRFEEWMHRNTPSMDATLNYQPDASHHASLAISAMQRGGLRTYAQEDSNTNTLNSTMQLTDKQSRGHDPDNMLDATFRLETPWQTPDQHVSLTVHQSISRQHEHYDYLNDMLAPTPGSSASNLDFHETHTITNASLDVNRSLGSGHTLKMGYVFEQQAFDFDNHANTLSAGTQTMVPITAQTDVFAWKETIHSAYQSLEYHGNTWSTLLGLRAELTDSRLQSMAFPSLVQQHTSIAVFPSLHVDHPLSEESTLSLAAGRRIARPDPSNLNPYIDQEYSPNLRAGNPSLRPQYTSTLELGIDHRIGSSTIGMNAYWRQNRDSVTDVTQYPGNGISLATKENLPHDRSIGMEFSGSVPLGSWVSVGGSGNAFRTQIDATALGFPGLQSTSGINLKAKFDIHPGKADLAQIHVTRTDRRLTPQGSISPITVVNLGYRRKISPSLSLVATVSDALNGQHYHRTIAGPLLTQDYQRAVEGRVAFVGVTYAIQPPGKSGSARFDFDSGD